MRIRIVDLLKIFGVYRLYQKWLYTQIKKGEMPRHVGFILDGNRRWASRYRVSKEYAYAIGADKVTDVIKWAKDLGIKSLTFFVFSTENIKRPKDEVSIIFNIFREKLVKALEDEDLVRNGVRIKFIGDRKRVPRELLMLMDKVEKRTSECNNILVNIAFLYGGKWDIISATKKIVSDVLNRKLKIEDITAETFQRYLSTSYLNDNQDVDLILRTGGEYRLSNFLLWQAAYSELIFLDIYWPEFRKIDFMRAIRTYQQRHRRFGQ